MAQHPTPGGICLHICAFISLESFAKTLFPARSFLHTPQTPARVPRHEATCPESQAGESLILHTLPPQQLLPALATV